MPASTLTTSVDVSQYASNLATRHAQAGSAELHQLQQSLLRLEQEAKASAALLEILEKMQSCRDLRRACYTLVNQLQTFLGCERVALGLGRGRKHSCQLAALSGVAKFDRRCELVRSIEATLDEAIARDCLSVWPPASEVQRHALLAHKKLCSEAGSACVISLPLRDEQAALVGAWLMLGTESLSTRDGVVNFTRAGARPVATSLQVLQQAERGPIGRLLRAVFRSWRSWWGRAALAGAGLLAVALCLPLPYKVGCDCQLQPVTRRFVVAPHQGILEKTLVEPGDVVSEGDLLARMDGREIRCELAGLQAEYDRAAKKHGAALASYNVATAQVAKLEMERLSMKIQLLRHRAENLEIASPLSGIVISGDLKQAEGAPLTIGQTLYEVAPLDKMIVELAVPEDEIANVRAGLDVTIRLDAYPRKTWHGTITKIHPRSEMKEQQAVFVAEVRQDNSSGVLRPGMHGDAKIIGPRHPLAWNLFHRPLESLAVKLGW